MWSDVAEAETIPVPAVPGPGVVAVIGLGRLGLPRVVQFASRGWRVLGCDLNPRVVECLNGGLLPICEEPELENELPGLLERGLFTATVNIGEAVARAKVIVVMVPARLDEHQQVDFQDLDATTEVIGQALQPGSLVCYEATLPVGTTQGRLRAMLESCSGLDASQEFFLAYSPERTLLGHGLHDLRTYPKIVGGIDLRSTWAAVAFYRSVLPVEILTLASAAEAEFTRLIELTYQDVNIALANEFACYADEHGLDVMAAIAAANTSPAAHILQPGVGVGGHALPVYPYFLINDTPPGDPGEFQHLRMPRVARQINDGMAEYAVQRIEAAAGSLWRRSVLLLGVACRAETRETTLSSAYLLQTALWRRGATVYVDDPLYTPAELHTLGFQPLPPGRENEIDAMILQMAHRAYQNFDFRKFPRCRVILDGRYGLLRERAEDAGIRYMALGDGREDAAQCLPPVRGKARS